MEKAAQWLEKKLGSLAVKRAGRETRAGVVDAYIHSNGRMGVMLELYCETDFVARNPAFHKLAHDLAMHITAMNPEDEPLLLAEPFVKEEGKTVGDLINEAIGKFGENIKIGRFIRFEL